MSGRRIPSKYVLAAMACMVKMGCHRCALWTGPQSSLSQQPQAHSTTAVARKGPVAAGVLVNGMLVLTQRICFMEALVAGVMRCRLPTFSFITRWHDRNLCPIGVSHVTRMHAS